jgi:hypothetical protein
MLALESVLDELLLFVDDELLGDDFGLRPTMTTAATTTRTTTTIPAITFLFICNAPYAFYIVRFLLAG